MRKSAAILKRVGSILAPAGYVFAVLVLFQFFCVQVAIGFYENPQGNLVPLGKKPQANARGTIGLPERLNIPSLHVNAAIRSVGLTSTGAMDAPQLPRDTAWYMLGPKPGEKGSAVIAGHVNWWSGATGVFERLNTLKPGDRISVQDEHGATTTFVVRETRIYGQKADASNVFRSYDGKAHLNLVTCSGVWDKRTKQYSKRLVVFTDKVVE